MGPTPTTSPRAGAAAFAAGVLAIVTAVTIALGAAEARADDVATWQARVQQDASRLADLRAERVETAAEVAEMQARHDEMLADVRVRLVALYKQGTTGGMERILEAGSVGEAGSALAALDTLERHERDVIETWVELGSEIDRGEQRVARLGERIDDAAGELQAARERLAQERREAEAARRRAIELARTKEPAFGPRALSPTSIAQASAAAEEGDVSSEAAPMQAAPAPTAAPSGHVETGTASMYADYFAGRPTASGEPYDPNAMTAAHPSLAFGTWVLVEGPGGTASVRINDRGPFVGGRIIDLSRAAAGAVGLGGLATVTISVQS